MLHYSIALALLVGCIDGEQGSTHGPLGKADGLDSSDRSCHIVLRTLGQPSGLPTNSSNGVNWVVYEARVDVASGTDGAPMVLWSNDGSRWWQTDGTKIAGELEGYDRYKLTLDEYTVAGGDSTAWRSMRIRVIPFLQFADGRRVFDHNRYPGDFDNYTLTKDETRYGDDPAVCH